MPQFLTPEHHSELSDILTRAHSQGAQESDLTQIRDHYLQQRSLTDRNYGEMTKPTDAPVWRNASDIPMAFLKRAGQTVSSVLGPSHLKARAETLAQSYLAHPEQGLEGAVFRDAGNSLEGMRQQAIDYGTKAANPNADPESRAVSAAQSAISAIPGASQTVPLGEDLKNTGDLSNVGGAGFDLGMAMLPAIKNPLGRLARAGSESAYSSTFSSEAAAGDVSAASKALANEAPVAMSNRSLQRTLETREPRAQTALDAQESVLDQNPNTIDPARINKNWVDKVNRKSGAIDTPVGPVSAYPELQMAAGDEVQLMKDLMSKKSMTPQEALDWIRGSREASVARGGVMRRPGGARPDAPNPEPPDATSARFRAEAAQPGLAQAAPELSRALKDLHEAMTTKNLKLASPVPARDAAIAGTVVGGVTASPAAGVAAATLYKLLGSPAAKTLSGAALSHISRLLKAGDIASATAVTQAALASRQSQPKESTQP